MDQKETVSVVVPVWDEASGIGATIRHIRQVERQCRVASVAEILVCDGHPQRSTLRALADSAASSDGSVVCVASPPGRGMQMNAGATKATGDILLFLHADTRLPDRAFDLMASALSTALPLAGAFDLDIDTEGLPGTTALALSMVVRFARLRSRLERKPYGDQGLFIRKQDFLSIGGYPEIPIMEDVAMHKRILALGEDIVILPQRVRTSPRRWLAEGILSRTLRNWRLRLCYALGVPPEKLVEDYRPGRGEGA